MCLKGRCVASDQPMSYWPFRDVLKTYFGIVDGDKNEDIWRKFDNGIKILNIPAELGMRAYICDVLSVAMDAECAAELEHKSPEQVRQQAILCLRSLFEHIGRRTRLLLVLEDLHWADDLSFDLLTMLLASLASSTLFILCLFRLETGQRTSQLGIIAQNKCVGRFSEVTLHRLDDQDCRRMVEHLLGSEQLPDEAVELIVRKSEGIPFFVEEVIRSLLDRSALRRVGCRPHFQSPSAFPL